MNMCHFGAVRMWIGKSVLNGEGWADMKQICKNCDHCYTEYMIGNYPTPVCTLHGYLEELDNPYHNIGERCPDYMHPISNLVGTRAKLMILDDLGTPDCNTCEYPNECENCARAIEDR